MDEAHPHDRRRRRDGRRLREHRRAGGRIPQGRAAAHVHPRRGERARGTPSGEGTAKQGDIAELRRKAKLYDEAEEASKTETQKLTEQNQKQAARIAQLEHGKLVSDACMAHGIPAEYADLVTGADEEAVNASAAKVAKLIGGAAKHATETPAVTVPSEGTRPAASGSKTIYELIAAAEKNGDAAKAIALKSMLLADKN